MLFYAFPVPFRIPNLMVVPVRAPALSRTQARPTSHRCSAAYFFQMCFAALHAEGYGLGTAVY